MVKQVEQASSDGRWQMADGVVFYDPSFGPTWQHQHSSSRNASRAAAKSRGACTKPPEATCMIDVINAQLSTLMHHFGGAWGGGGEGRWPLQL